jgi:type I restriction enzyme S subunit
MNWPQVQLSPALAKVVRGVTFSQADASSVPFDGAVPVLRAGNIQERLIIDQDLSWVSRSFVSTDQYLQMNDIVVCTSSGSASLVGKSAILDAEFEGSWGAFNAVIRSNPDILLPEYIAYWLSSDAFRAWKDRQVQGANIQNIRQSAIENIRLPLPTLHEQQRIVDVLRQTKELGVSRKASEETIQELTREYFNSLFGNVIANDKGWAIRKLGKISEIVRGSSPRPQGDPRLFGGPVPRLMVSDLTRDGLWVDATTDSLTLEGAKSSRPMPAQSVVIAVSGAPGLTAILNYDACIHDGFVGLRDLNAALLPEFVAFTLNLLRAKNDQQAVGAVFRNLTTDQVKAISIPVPPVELQKQFRSFLMQVKMIQKDIVKSKRLLDELTLALTVEAFSSELTTSWREQNQKEIEAAAIVRDTLLRERGVKFTSRLPEPVPLAPATKDTKRQARQWLMDELSEFQRQVFKAFSEYTKDTKQPLIVEDADIFSRFCDDEYAGECLKAFGPSLNNRIRRTLSQLSALGLIAKVTLPKQTAETGELEYLKAFRPLREAEFTKMSDVESIRRALKLGAEVKYYSLSVHLDYGTSERTGAGGMFQVISIEDEDANDLTHLVDQGVHYSSLAELKQDIAAALKVTLQQVELEEV